MKNPEEEVRRAVALAIHAPEAPERVLAVLRPPDDLELPDMWGLPAGSVRTGETASEAALRAGREKLGVEISAPRRRRRGSTERPGYRLEMDLFEAEITGGDPNVPQPATGVTQYIEWRWAKPNLLAPAAARGSLCCRLFLEGEGADPP